jgi:hypothetical protein
MRLRWEPEVIRQTEEGLLVLARHSDATLVTVRGALALKAGRL